MLFVVVTGKNAHNSFNGISLRLPDFAIQAELLRDWHVKSKGFDVEVELNYHLERRGFAITEVPIQYRNRLGEKKLKVTHGAPILERIMLKSPPEAKNK